MTPGEIDEALQAWLPQPVASSVKAELRWRKRDEQDLERSEPFIASYDCAGGFGDEDASEALRILEMLNARADRGDCVQAVVRLKALTVSRLTSEEDMAVQIAAMTEELSAYPLDVVRGACQAWTQQDKFFPAWAELRELCESLVLKRRSLLNALRRYFGRKPGEQAGTDSAEQESKGSPYNDLWRTKRNALVQAVGSKAFGAWLSTVTPVDPGSDAAFYQLGAPTRFIRDWVDREYRELIEGALERPVRVIVYNFSVEGAKRRASSRSGT
jgi:hypothetical protein